MSIGGEKRLSFLLIVRKFLVTVIHTTNVSRVLFRVFSVSHKCRIRGFEAIFQHPREEVTATTPPRRAHPAAKGDGDAGARPRECSSQRSRSGKRGDAPVARRVREFGPRTRGWARRFSRGGARDAEASTDVRRWRTCWMTPRRGSGTPPSWSTRPCTALVRVARAPTTDTSSTSPPARRRRARGKIP